MASIVRHRVAVASSDGEFVDEHFGNALYYQVYDEAPGGEWSLIETRKVSAGCGAEAIFVLRIGPSAAAGAIAAGLRVFEAGGPVDDMLDYVAANGLLDVTGTVS